MEDRDDLSYMVRKLQEAYEQSLITNKKKSEYMIFGNNGREDLPLEDDNIGEVGKCKYFGALFTKNSNSNEDINNGVNKDKNL
jgi:hypothetical protein